MSSVTVYSVQDLPLLGFCDSVVERHFKAKETVDGRSKSTIVTFHIFYGHGCPDDCSGSTGDMFINDNEEHYTLYVKLARWVIWPGVRRRHDSRDSISHPIHLNFFVSVSANFRELSWFDRKTIPNYRRLMAPPVLPTPAGLHITAHEAISRFRIEEKKDPKSRVNNLKRRMARARKKSMQV